jgi:hypothetical protein
MFNICFETWRLFQLPVTIIPVMNSNAWFLKINFECNSL